MATMANNWQTPGASDPGRYNLLASQQTILPTSRWIDIQHLSCIFYLLSSSSSSRPNQTTPSAPPSSASHGWLRLRRPTVCTSNVGQSLPLFPHTSCYSPATSAPTRTRARTSQPSYSPPPATGPTHLPRLMFVPSEASPPSSALQPWFARRARSAALLHCQHCQQSRGTRR